MKRNSALLTVFTLMVSFCSSAQLKFQESAAAYGVAASYGNSTLGGGVAFVDFDQDGWDDLTYATEEGREIMFFRNTGNGFIAVDLGIHDTFETKQVLWVDFDNDGDQDLFATAIKGPNRLYENNGELIFKDITEESGLFTEDLYSYGAAFGDIDNDGDLDLFITHRDVISRDQKNYLYEFNSGTYTDITEQAGLYLGNDLSFCASFFDYDRDGFLDIYVSNDKYTQSNKLYRNRGNNTFEDVSESSGAGIAIDAMSTTIGDYNADGWLDIYVTNTTGGNQQLRNNGDGTFTNVAEELGTAMYSIGWGAVFLDADNDTDLDLYVSGMLGPNDSRLPSAFYHYENGNYSIPSGIGFEEDTRKSFGNAIGDLNNDGYPDISVMNDAENNFLWENQSDPSNNWVKLGLEGSISHKSGIGSWLEVYSGGAVQYHYTLCGEGYLGQNSTREFIGLGSANQVDSLKVRWLSGVEDVIRNLPANATYKIVEGSNAAVEIVVEAPAEGNPEDMDEEDVQIDEAVADESSIETESICPGGSPFLYPNPSINGTYALCTESQNRFRLAEIFDLQGRRVATRNMEQGGSTFDLSTLRGGIYIVRFSGNSDTMLKKVIKL